MASKNRRSILLREIASVPFQKRLSAITVEIAGLKVRFHVEDFSLRARICEYFSSYLSDSDGEPDGEICAEPLAGKDLWEDSDPEFQVEGFCAIQRDFVAKALETTSQEPAQAVARLAPGLDDALHNLLRWFLPPILLRKGGFLLHGAGIIRDGKGHAFFGQSGSGKSTSSGLVAQADPDALVVGDDAVIIRMQDNQAWLHSAPLGCGYSRQAPPRASVPLARLLRLEQAEENSVDPLARSEGVATLLASAMDWESDLSGDKLRERIELALRFAGTGRGVQRLRFRKNPGFWFELLKLEGEEDGKERHWTQSIER